MSLSGLGRPMFKLLFTPDGKTLITNSDQGAISLWDLATGKLRRELKDEAITRSIAISPDGRTLVAGQRAGVLSLWDIEAGEKLVTLKAHDDLILGVSFSPDGKSLATASVDKTAKILGFAGPAFESVPWPFGRAMSVAYAPDGKTVPLAPMIIPSGFATPPPGGS